MDKLITNKNSLNKESKVKESISLNQKVFKEIFPLKNSEDIDNLSYHISDKKKIINQFKEGSDIKSFLNENLPDGNILYIDFFEVRPNRRNNGIGTKIIQKIISKSKDIGFKGIYLDSYEWSMVFWERNGFTVDYEEQEEKDGEESDYHSAFMCLN